MKQPTKVIDTRQGQGRNRLSRADLLWSLLAADADQHDQLAEKIGFEAQQQAIQERKPQANNLVEKDEIEANAFEENTDTQVSEELPKPASNTSSYYRITDRSIDQTHPNAEDTDLSLPDWFTNASPTILEETKTRIPKIHQVVPLHAELTVWSRLLPFLQRILGDQIEGVRPDLTRLVKQVSQGEFIRRIPRKKRYSWATDARILIDINDQNFPYRRDFIHLREQLEQIRGNEGLQVQYIYDEPGGYIARYDQQKELIEPWRMPEQGTPILILSDLGMQAKSRRSLYAWLVFGQIFKVQGFRPTVLMPVAERDIDSRLLKYFDCVVWDRTSRLKQIKGDYQAEKDKRNHPENIDQLLSYFFATVRVDSGLMRAVRHLLPATYDIGHEAAVWQHAVVNKEGDEWGWQASGKPQYLDKAKKLIGKLPLEQQQKLVELIGRYHALYSDELYFEAMYSLEMLGLPVPDEIQQATEKFMQDAVATYAHNLDNSLLHGWVKRHLDRHETEEIRKKHAYWLPFMAFVKVQENKHNVGSEIEWPDYLTKIDIEEILRFINHAKTYQNYKLRQVGEKLELTLVGGNARQAVTQDDWEGGAQVGATLLTMSLNDTQIFHIHTDARGNQRIVSLDLAQTADQSFQFPPNGQHEFQIGRERVSIDVMAAQQVKEPWMKFLSNGGKGLCAKSVDENDQAYDWYWHPPEWRSGDGLLRGFWYYLPVSRDTFKPDWAKEANRDPYGLYADTEIFGITQRFRWIEPTHFLMGSPEDEEGRLNNEPQHPVTLTQGYWLADTTCTQALWEAVMHENPSNFKGEMKPVENVSWDDIQGFLKRLGDQYPALKLRLPTEAEWENACRTGSISAFNFDGDLSLDKVNYRGTWDYKSGEWGKGALLQTAGSGSVPTTLATTSGSGLPEVMSTVRSGQSVQASSRLAAAKEAERAGDKRGMDCTRSVQSRKTYGIVPRIFSKNES